MTLHVEFSEILDRPVDKVFRFFAVEHVRNHPRWDPDIELWLESDSPIGVGTLIHRRNRRSGTPVEGTMQVTEFEPNRAMAVIIREGPAEMRSRAVFEAIGDNQTRLTTVLDIPAMDEHADTTLLKKALERSAQNRKQLIESET